MKAVEFADEIIRLSAAKRHRNAILLIGSASWQQNIVTQVFNHKTVAVVSNRDWGNSEVSSESIPVTQCGRLLGSEVDHVLFDAFDGYSANALGIISGCVRAGGLFVIIPPTESIISNGGFNLYCDRILRHSRSVYPVSEGEILPPPAQSDADINRESSDIDLFHDQQRAVEAICHVVTGQRKRPAVLVADRGRGKSAALGIAASQLLEQGATKILVSGRSRRAAENVFAHCESSGLVWVSIETLLSEPISCDLLLIDEAAGLPVPVLKQCLSRYPRIAMATTVHGYEGTGQGFMLRFKPILDTNTRGWRLVTLDLPIRWNQGDPLERLINKVLVQDATLPDLAQSQMTPVETCVEEVSKEQLQKDVDLLRDIFSLFSLAHYQTRPSDLSQLLDNTQLKIFRFSYKSNTIGVALVVLEGGMEEDLSYQIFSGKRRPEGHVLPEILASQLGQRHAGILKFARIMRIVIHPDIQRRGFGHHLLSTVIAKLSASIDIFGSHFSATTGLIRFWRSQGFMPVRIGQGRSVKTGGHSAVMLKKQTKEGAIAVDTAAADFALNLPVQIANNLTELEPELIIEILQKNKAFNQPPDSEVLFQLAGFCLGQRNAETLPAALLQFASFGICLGEFENPILWAERIMLRKDWADCDGFSGNDGWKSGNRILKEDAAKLMKKCFPEALAH